MNPDTSSMYDFAGPNYVAPVQSPSIKKPAPVQPVISGPEQPAENPTPHQNRPHGQLKYENNKQFQQKAGAATTTNAPPKTSALYEWGLLIASRDSSNYIAMKINKGFTRAKIGVNFQSEKARYLAEYEKLLMNGYKKRSLNSGNE